MPTDKTTIEITGAGFANKGAHLMLVSVCQRIREKCPDARLCMPLHHSMHFEQRAKMGVQLTFQPPVVQMPSKRVLQDALGFMAGKTPLAQMFGLVAEDQCDALLDISGYSFGDKWLPSRTLEFAKKARRYRDRGKPVIMLPQMLGPFSNQSHASAFTELGKHVDLMFARDQESFDHAKSLVPGQILRKAPDITILTPEISREAPDEFVAEERFVALVPNCRLLEGGSSEDWSDKYLDRLVVAANHARACGRDVKIVQHDYNEGDTRLVERLAREIGVVSSKVIRHDDPQVLKGVLSRSELVIGSRFHGLVSSLSMCVPSIAIGWAHKYEALLRDFNMPNCIHRADDTEDKLIQLMDELLSNRSALALQLSLRKQDLAEDVRGVWNDVYKALGF